MTSTRMTTVLSLLIFASYVQGQWEKCSLQKICFCSNDFRIVDCRGENVLLFPTFDPFITRVATRMQLVSTGLITLKGLEISKWISLKQLIITGNTHLYSCEQERSRLMKLKGEHVRLLMQCPQVGYFNTTIAISTQYVSTSILPSVTTITGNINAKVNLLWLYCGIPIIFLALVITMIILSYKVYRKTAPLKGVANTIYKPTTSVV